MTLSNGWSGIVVPLWILSVGIVGAFAPVPGVAASVFLALTCLIIVPAILTHLLMGRIRPQLSLADQDQRPPLDERR